MLKLKTLGLLPLCLCGCLSMTSGTKETIDFRTNPEGARIVLSNGASCVTPCSIEVPRKGRLQVTVSKEGCDSVTTTLVPKVRKMQHASAAATGVFSSIDYMRGAPE